jgi:hypothetical protein
VTELELLRRRRKLVVLSADVQRATAVCRLDRIERNPVRVVAEIAARATRVVIARRLSFAILALFGRMLRF